MKYRSKALLAVFMLLIIILPLTGCEPAAPIRIKNKTDQTLYISFSYSYSDHVEADAKRDLMGAVKAGEELRPEIFPFPTFLIEAKDVQGNIVYSKEFSYKELEKTDWKLVIPPLE